MLNHDVQRKNFYSLLILTILLIYLVPLLVDKLKAEEMNITLTTSPSVEKQLLTCDSKSVGVLQPIESGVHYLYLNIHLPPSATNTARTMQPLFKVIITQNGYQNDRLEKFLHQTTRQKKIKIPLYNIHDDLPFAINQVMVSTKINNQEFHQTMQFKVYRSILLQKDDDHTEDCMQMFKAEKITGLLSNASDDPREIEISDSFIKNTSVSQTYSKGWIAGVSLFSLLNFAVNVNWLKTYSKEIESSSTMTITTTIAPGAKLMLARQLSLIQDAYKVMSVNGCGEMKEVDTIFHRHWVVTYPVAKVDMTLANPFARLDVGYNDQLNTCQEEESLLTLKNHQVYLADNDVDRSSANDKQEIRYDVRVSDPHIFNDVGSMMNNEVAPPRERKSKFRSFLRRLFHRRR